jgi:serine/threonine protein kinase
MSLKTKVTRGGRVSFTKGLLAVTGRDPLQILRQQQIIMSNLSETIYKCATMSVNAELYDLLERMLAWDPSYRISPRAALRHPYLDR